MTITGMAKQLNVSTMTIYRRCKKKGVLLDDLRDGETGELTSAGVAVIASLFDTTTPQTALTGDTTQVQPGCNDDAQTASQGAAAASTAILQAKLDGATALIEQLTSERDALREQLAAAQAALAAEQADRADERQKLLPDGGQPRRRWWPWARR